MKGRGRDSVLWENRQNRPSDSCISENIFTNLNSYPFAYVGKH